MINVGFRYSFHLLISTTLVTLITCEFVTVRTSKGIVQGKRVDYGNNRNQLYHGQADVFLGIPYAKAPTGPMRFKAPQPPNAFNSMYNATYFRPRCPQSIDPLCPLPPNTAMNEDCLCLNVYTLQAGNRPVNNALAVLVLINGANNFATRGSDLNSVPGIVRNLCTRGIVVVTIQYRLGPLGFFTSYDSNFPPNLGMLDQVTALQWVQDEIANFGGDPNRVTLCGQASGACAVDAHTLSPMSQSEQ